MNPIYFINPSQAETANYGALTGTATAWERLLYLQLPRSSMKIQVKCVFGMQAVVPMKSIIPFLFIVDQRVEVQRDPDGEG